MYVFLGGTVGYNTWRDQFIKDLVAAGLPEDKIFNPVTTEWNSEAQATEEKWKAEAETLLFVLANPYQAGLSLSAYSMVEATMALYDRPDRTVVVFDNRELTGHALKAQQQAEKVLRKRFPQGFIFSNMEEAVAFYKQHYGWTGDNQDQAVS